jgi:hypothetical protein
MGTASTTPLLLYARGDQYPLYSVTITSTLTRPTPKSALTPDNVKVTALRDVTLYGLVDKY